MSLKLSDFNPGEVKEVEAPQKTKGGFKQTVKNFLGGFIEEISTIPRAITKQQTEALQKRAGDGSRFGEFAQGAISRAENAPLSPFKTEEQRLATMGAEPGTFSTGAGKFAGLAAQYLAPTSQVTKGQQILGAAARQIPTTMGGTGLLRTAGNLGLGATRLAAQGAARFIPEAIGTGAVSLARTGGDLEQAKKEATIAGSVSVGLGALGGLARATYWPMLDDSVNKALGVQGKKSGGVALQQTAQKISGLQVLKNRAKDLTVTTDDGAKVAFDPQNASYSTTLQAWKQAREKVFKEYTEMASKAGEKATLDMSPVRQQIVEALDAPILSVEKNAVRSLLRDFDEIFKDPTNVDMQMAERFVKSLNENTVQGFFTGTSDAASSKVNAGTSRLIREMMDDVIEETTGAQYQATRSQYAALKSLEDDLVRKFQQDARSIGGGLPEYTGAFASGDIIGSALSLDPAQFAKGATLGTFSLLKRKLSNPERFLRRSFDLIDEAPSDLSSRIWGGTKPLTATEQKAADAVAESVKNPATGMSIKSTVSPEKVAANIDAEDVKNTVSFLNGENTPVIKKMLDAMGIGNASEEIQKQFLKDMLKEADSTPKLKELLDSLDK